MQLKIITIILSFLLASITILYERSQIIYFERGAALLEKKITKNTRYLEVKKKELNENMSNQLYKQKDSIDKKKPTHPSEA